MRHLTFTNKRTSGSKPYQTLVTTKGRVTAFLGELQIATGARARRAFEIVPDAKIGRCHYRKWPGVGATGPRGGAKVSGCQYRRSQAPVCACATMYSFSEVPRF